MSVAAAFLALATLAAAPAPAPEDWRSISTDGDKAVLVDMANIRNEGALRVLRLKLVDPDAPGDAFTEAALGCTAKSFEIRRIDLVKDGKTIKTETFEAGHRPTHPLDDGPGTALLKLVCPQ